MGGRRVFVAPSGLELPVEQPIQIAPRANIQKVPSPDSDYTLRVDRHPSFVIQPESSRTIPQAPARYPRMGRRGAA